MKSKHTNRNGSSWEMNVLKQTNPMINYADVSLGARLTAHSPEREAPNGFAAAITPVLAHEDKQWHYAAADRPVPNGASEDEFEVDLGREVEIRELAIEWYADTEAGIEFRLEAKQQDTWVECVHETRGHKKLNASQYQTTLKPTVRARFFRYRQTKALGQNRLLIRQFQLWGPGKPPKRVLMVAPDCFMIDRRILQQARTLIEHGCRVTLVSGFECPQEAHYFQDGVEIHRFQYDWDDERLKKIRAKLPENDRLRMFVNRAFLAIARRCLPLSPFDLFALTQACQFPADVVHIHDLPCLKYGTRLAAQWGVPLVFDAHEIYYEQECLPPRQQRALKRQERRGARHVDLFITVNQAIADWYADRYGIKPMVLMNCADGPTKIFGNEQRRGLRDKAGLPHEARVVLYQGWISSERNITTLVQAAEFLPDDAYLVLIGYGEHEQHLRSLADGQPWADKVRFLGRVEPDEILGLTAGADVGVIPYQPIDLNHKLCSPNKFFEYVQTGVPVVAEDLVFFREMAERYGVVALGRLATPQGMADTINGLLADPNRLEIMRHACNEAAQTLNWQTEGNKLIQAYKTILADA